MLICSKYKCLHSVLNWNCLEFDKPKEYIMIIHTFNLSINEWYLLDALAWKRLCGLYKSQQWIKLYYLNIYKEWNVLGKKYPIIKILSSWKKNIYQIFYLQVDFARAYFIFFRSLPSPFLTHLYNLCFLALCSLHWL